MNLKIKQDRKIQKYKSLSRKSELIICRRKKNIDNLIYIYIYLFIYMYASLYFMKKKLQSQFRQKSCIQVGLINFTQKKKVGLIINTHYKKKKKISLINRQ